MKRRLALWAFVVAAVALTAWGVATWISPSTQCRGQEMSPDDVCTYSSYTDDKSTEKTQTYEERIAASRQSAPVVVVLGVAAAVFGTVVAVRSQESGSETKSRRSDR